MSGILHVLTWTGCAALALYVTILAVKFHLACRYAARHPDRACRDEPVTVLQPILSGDPALEDPDCQCPPHLALRPPGYETPLRICYKYLKLLTLMNLA